MAVSRCPHCQVILTEDELAAPACPDCGVTLNEPSVPAAPAGLKPHAPPRAGGAPWLMLAGGVVLLVFAYLVGIWRGSSEPLDAGHLRETLEAVQEQARVARSESAQARADRATSEKAASDSLGRVESLQKELAGTKELAQSLEAEKKSALARLEPLQAFKDALTVGAPGVARPTGGDGSFRIYFIDRPEGEYRLSTMNNGTQIKLVGKVKTLRTEHLENANLDASELIASEIIIGGGINGKSKIKLNAAQVTVPYIDNQSQVDITAGDGKVQIGWVNGGAKVNVVAKEIAMRDYLDGVNTTVTATLAAGGKLSFREIRGQAKLHWKKARETDPDVEVKPGLIRAPAEFRRITPED